jgi:hypothetical protein
MPDSVAGARSAEMVAANDLGSLVAVMRAFGGFQIGRAPRPLACPPSSRSGPAMHS